jgi:hypothetical protein
MASDDGSFITNPFPDDTPNLAHWGFGGNYGSIPSAPVTDLLSSIASAGLGAQAEAEPRMATPNTQARQEAMGRLILTERQRYMAETNASEAGSIMENHMNGYMRGLEHGTNLNAAQGSSIASPTTTERVNNQSYLNLDGSLTDDEGRARIEPEVDLLGHADVAGHFNPSDTQKQAVDDTASLGHGSNVEGVATTQINQTNISNIRRQPFFEQVAYPATSTYPAQNTFGQAGIPIQGNLYAPPPPVDGFTSSDLTNKQGQSNVGRSVLPPYVNESGQDNIGSLDEPTSTNGRRQSDFDRPDEPSFTSGPRQSHVDRFNGSLPTNGRRQVNFGRLDELSSTAGPGQSDVGRVSQSTSTNGRRSLNVGRLGGFIPLNRRAQFPTSRFRRPSSTTAQGQGNLRRLNASVHANAQEQPGITYLGRPLCAQAQGQLYGGRIHQPSVANDQDPFSDGPVRQPTSSDAQARTADQSENGLIIVNFPGTFGWITQIDHVNDNSGDELPVIAFTGLNSYPATYVTANNATGGTTNGANGHVHDVRRDCHISETSSTSTLRRRAGVNDLSREAGNQHGTPNLPRNAHEQEHMAFVTLSFTPRGEPPTGLLSIFNHHATVKTTPS